MYDSLIYSIIVTSIGYFLNKKTMKEQIKKECSPLMIEALKKHGFIET